MTEAMRRLTDGPAIRRVPVTVATMPDHSSGHKIERFCGASAQQVSSTSLWADRGRNMARGGDGFTFLLDIRRWSGNRLARLPANEEQGRGIRRKSMIRHTQACDDWQVESQTHR